ncbi:subtilase family protein [Hirsutella rhossiliensis]
MQLPRLCALVCSALVLVLAVSAPDAVAAGREEQQHLRDEAFRRARRRHVGRGPRSTQNKFIIEVQPGFRTSNLIRQPETAGAPRVSSAYQVFNCSGLFRGFVVEAQAESVEELRGIDGVINAWPVRTVRLPPTVRHPTVKSAPRGAEAANASVHRWTGVDKLHAAGMTGKGVKVAIVDSGVDYTHKALGGCFGPGCRVMGGYDFVGGKWEHQPEPDGNPVDYDGHGTHVAGIVGGNADGFLGVAPEAQLLAYKVFDDAGNGTTEDVIIQSFCDAYSAGADIITSSIGMGSGFSDGPWSLVASRIVGRGVVVTISAGNDGNNGPFSSGNGCNGRGVLSVAAINITEDAKSKRVRFTPARFTSWGPTNELWLKPDIGAPGVKIMSTALKQGFKALDGTSMAAPYIAGVAALFIGQRGGREIHGSEFARRLAKRIIGSGQSVSWSANTALDNQTSLENATAPPVQVGTGLVDAGKVLGYTTELMFEPIALRDTRRFQPKWEVGIVNKGKDKVKYRFEVESQSAVEIYNGHDGIRKLPKLRPSCLDPVISLPKPEVVRAGQMKSIVLNFSLPLKANDSMLPVYGGKIWIKGDNGEELCIPYAGAAYDTGKAFATMFRDVNRTANDNGTWTWTMDTQKYMELKAVLAYPCTNLRWDIFASNWTERDWVYPPQANKGGYVGSVAAVPVLKESAGDDNNNKSKATGFPFNRVPRGKMSYRWFGELTNRTQIAPGNYTMRFAALRPYGDPHSADHWDVLPMGARGLEIRRAARTRAKRTSDEMGQR